VLVVLLLDHTAASIAVAHTQRRVVVVVLLLLLHMWVVLNARYSGVDAYAHVRHPIVRRVSLDKAVVLTRVHCVGVLQESSVLFRVVSIADESPVGRIPANTIVRLCASNA
jgi:hypothetical protein